MWCGKKFPIDKITNKLRMREFQEIGGEYFHALKISNKFKDKILW